MPDRLEKIEAPEVVGAEGNGRGLPALRHTVQDVAVYAALEKLWGARRRFVVIVGIFLCFALLYLFGTRREYTATATLMPEQQSDSPNIAGLDLLENFGGLLGGLSSNSILQKQNTLPVQIYPEILDSTPILVELLKNPVPSENGTVAVGLYLRERAPFSLWESTGHTIAAVTSWMRPARTPVTLADSSVIFLNSDEMDVVDDLRDRVTVDLDKKTGILSVSATMPDPLVSAALASASVQALTAYVTRYRLHKLERDLAFVNDRYVEAQSRFNRALDQLAVYQDRNQNLSRNLARTEVQRLQAEYDLAFSVYSSLATKLEEARIKVQEETPVFQVLQPVTVPLKKSHPRTMLILLFALLLGMAAASAIILSGVDRTRIRSTLKVSA